MAEMVGVVASAVAQEGVSGVSSYISNKLEEKASAGHGIQRLEMLLSQVEFVLERTGKVPITYISLLRRRKVIERAYNEGTSLLNKHKHGIGQEVTRSSVPFLERIIGRARNSSMSSLLGLSKEEHLSSSVVRRYEWLADCAEKFVIDVESGCPLRNGGIFRYPLERHLLEGKTLMHKMVRGSQSRYICIWPVCSEGRGVEVELVYSYEDRKMPAKNLNLQLYLRISQGTSIVETAIRCLQLLASQFNFVTESTIGEEITLLSSLQDISHSYAAPLGQHEEYIVRVTEGWRPDPICCANNIVSSESSHGVPEPVILISFSCWISAREYMLHSSTDEVVGINAPLLYLQFSIAPHISDAGPPGISLMSEEYEHINGSGMQLMEEMARSKAIDCLLRQPGLARNAEGWCYPRSHSRHAPDIRSLLKNVCNDEH
ncbi:uncharacterized protein LOC133889954 isoform X2 [Phragmites australis]|uniref:uncharacterized protein LOC133889954 isoform X2 n=1 Tax=Phragmites australis TaxID=29695 RepID=UPI002D7774C8|nr:uncharacterized protein LOC133889954 isoform X2 [Phragmites australis]